MATAYSSLHQQKAHRPPKPSKAKPLTKMKMLPPPTSTPTPILPPHPSPTDELFSRSSSLAGRKRARDSDGDGKAVFRRTKSVGESRDRDREALQRGLIAVFVPKALEESTRGVMGNYNDLLASLLPTPLMPNLQLAPLLPLIRALTANVNLLVPGLHDNLVNALLNLPWATGEERFVKAYIGLAGVLISAKPDWVKQVIGMAVKGFLWRPASSSSSPSTPSAISRRIFHARHHLLLTHLLSLIPTLPNILGPLLIRHFPHKREREVGQITYLRNICEVSEYCPELATRIWGEIVDRMLRIDVEITKAADIEDEDEEEEEEERLIVLCRNSDVPGEPWDMLVTQDIPQDPTLNQPSHGDDEDVVDLEDLSSDDGEAEDEEEPTDASKAALAKAKKRLHLILMRRKLDGMLCYFFRHVEESMGYRSASPPASELAASTITAASSGQSTPTTEVPTPVLPSPANLRRIPPSPAQRLATFQTLLNIFSRQILPTSATQHIPFVLFLTTSFSASHVDLFLGLLVSMSLYGSTTASPSNISQPVSLNQRVAATVYIGSIVCRARFVSDDQARMVITYLLAYMDGKLRQSKLSAKVDELPLFYAVCQAVMLIFCFRWRAFQVAEKDDEIVGEMELEGESEAGQEGRWISELDVLQRALTSELNPLLGCNPTIVQTFAKVAHQNNFAYCFSIIESNASAARSASSHSLTTAASRPPSLPGTSRQNSLQTSASSSSILNPQNQPTKRTSLPTPTSAASSIHMPTNLAIPRQARQINIDTGLDGYFPFDPYDLPRSGEKIEKLYRTWGDVAVDGNDDDDSDDSDDDDLGESSDESDEEDEEEEDAMDSPLSKLLLPRSPRVVPRSRGVKLGSSSDRRRLLRDGGLSSSFDGMSISPNP